MNKFLQSTYSVIEQQKLDAVIVVPGANFRRIFNRDFHLMERPLLVIIPADGEPVAIVPNLEMASFEKIDFKGKVFDWRDETGYQSAFQAASRALPGLKSAGRIGLEGQRMRVFEHLALMEAFPDAAFIDAHAAISSMRLIKSADEISKLTKAIQISERALEATLQEIRIGDSEKQIEAILLRQLFAHGGDGLSFEPIVAAADNSAQPHASARHDYEIKTGDALLVDFGASWQGYNADITRTFFVEQVSDYDRSFYQSVLDANQRGQQIAKAGISAHDVDDAVQNVLENSPFSEFRRHKTGHGLGLEVHEAPHIMRGNNQMLEAGMVFTIEPGLYRHSECGVRIEDDVVVTAQGVDCLTTFPRHLRTVG